MVDLKKITHVAGVLRSYSNFVGVLLDENLLEVGYWPVKPGVVHLFSNTTLAILTRRRPQLLA